VAFHPENGFKLLAGLLVSYELPTSKYSNANSMRGNIQLRTLNGVRSVSGLTTPCLAKSLREVTEG
jgi:hypothetical protein